jgi:DNA polymerase-3 subunit delta
VDSESPDKLIARLKAGKLIPAIVLQGSDAYLRDLCRRTIVETYVAEAAREWAVVRASARENTWEEIEQRAQTLPMLSPVQVLIVSDLRAWERLGEESAKELSGGLGAYLKSPAPFTVLVFEADQLDERRRLKKALTANTLVVELVASGREGPGLAARMAAELETRIEPGAAAMLAEMFPGDLGRVRAEMEKLALYADGRAINREDIELLVVTERKATVWQLADILATGKRDQAMIFLDSALRAGEQPTPIVGALAWMYRKLIEARELPAGSSKFDASRRLGMKSETADVALRASRRIPVQALRRGLVALAETDSRLKSGIAQPRGVLEFLVANLTAN